MIGTKIWHPAEQNKHVPSLRKEIWAQWKRNIEKSFLAYRLWKKGNILHNLKLVLLFSDPTYFKFFKCFCYSTFKMGIISKILISLWLDSSEKKLSEKFFFNLKSSFQNHLKNWRWCLIVKSYAQTLQMFWTF